MATHSSVLAWRIPGIGEPGGLLVYGVTQSQKQLKQLGSSCSSSMSIESVMPSSHLIICHPLLLPRIPPSIRVFSNESALCMRWPKYWSFSINISPSNEHLGLISFRMDWLDLLVVQRTLKSLLHGCTCGGFMSMYGKTNTVL